MCALVTGVQACALPITARADTPWLEQPSVKLKYLSVAFATALCLAAAGTGLAQHAPPPVQKVTAATPATKLIVMIAVDPFSADLFSQSRSRSPSGLAIGSAPCRDRECR